MLSVRDSVTAIINHTPRRVARLFGSDKLLARLLRPLINRLLPSGPMLVLVRSGPGADIRLLVYPTLEKYYWTGTHERPVQEAIARILKPGMTFWDIGAHIGFFSLLGGRLVGNSGHVHAFEPLLENRRRLFAGIEASALSNVSVHEFAVTASGGEVLLRAHESSLMWSTVPDWGEEYGVTVPCRTLDQLARCISSPNLIKVDAEGAELDVLSGGLSLLSRAKPALVVEFSNDGLVNEARGLLPWYEFTRLTSSHWLLLNGRKS